MISQLRNIDGVFGSFVHNSMFCIDSPGPVAGKAMFQRFGFANAFKRGALDFLDEGVDSLENLLVRWL